MSIPAPRRPDDVEPAPSNTSDDLFQQRAPQAQTLPLAAWAVAGLVVLLVLGGLLLLGRHHNTPSASATLPLDPYAASLPITSVVMSESISLSGGKSTFVDGHIHNSGNRTVTGATVQVFFRNDEGMPPSIESLSLPVIRTREPYIDTEPISAAPLQPGEDREFRLIFETLPGNWNTQIPEIHIVHVSAQ